VIFSPYTSEQLVEILNVKLRDSIGCFDKTSIKLIASKVSRMFFV
jgi:Cdc6-like AAA superfamily ATPase